MKRISEESGMIYRLGVYVLVILDGLREEFGIPSLQQGHLLPMLCTFDLGQCSMYMDKIIVE